MYISVFLFENSINSKYMTLWINTIFLIISSLGTCDCFHGSIQRAAQCFPLWQIGDAVLMDGCQVITQWSWLCIIVKWVICLEIAMLPAHSNFLHWIVIEPCFKVKFKPVWVVMYYISDLDDRHACSDYIIHF